MDNLPNGQTANEPSLNNNNNASQINSKEIDLDFLPLIYEIVKNIEREPVQDTTGKSRESQDISAKVLELEKKLSEARKQIFLLPGIEHSKEEQLRQLERCREQVLLKQQLIKKLAESYPIRRAAQMVVYLFNRGKAITEDSDVVKKIENTKLQDKLKNFRDYLEKKTKE